MPAQECVKSMQIILSQSSAISLFNVHTGNSVKFYFGQVLLKIAVAEPHIFSFQGTGHAITCKYMPLASYYL